MASLERALVGAGGPLLLLGPPSSARSALSFRAALAGASAAPPSAGVLFLAPRPLERLPGGRGGGGGIEKIHFLYPSSFRELLQLLASLHQTLPHSPSMIVLDGLEEYLSGCSSVCTAAQFVALLLDTSNHFTQKRRLSVGRQLIASMRLLGEAGEEAEHFSVIERYFPAKLWLHPDTGKDGASDNQSLARLIRAQLFQPGTKDQEWMVKFDAQGSMAVSLLPCVNETEDETVSEERPPDSEVDSTLPSLQA